MDDQIRFLKELFEEKLKPINDSLRKLENKIDTINLSELCNRVTKIEGDNVLLNKEFSISSQRINNVEIELRQIKFDIELINNSLSKNELKLEGQLINLSDKFKNLNSDLEILILAIKNKKITFLIIISMAVAAGFLIKTTIPAKILTKLLTFF